MRRAGLLLVVLALVMGTLAGAPSAPAAPATHPVAAVVRPPLDLSGSVPASFTVRPGVELLTVTGAPPLTPLTLVDSTDTPLVTVTTDPAGQLVIPYLPTEYLAFDPNVEGMLPTVDGTTVAPGTYRVVDEGPEPMEASPPFEVLGVDDTPVTALYDGQTLDGVHTNATGGFQPGVDPADGVGYIETRDGTQLSVMVRFPDPDLYGPGPYPTVVEYSGYGPSNPTNPEPGSMIANTMGFAAVGVNLRGTGCSGGTFDTFNAAQTADGYDAVEVIARQPWVKHNHVGMVGLSYSGITQLYVASANPPSLAAITPASVIEDPWYQQWPGGNYNAGFTQQWLAQRDSQSAPGGVSWVQKRIDSGDTTCEDNLDLRSQNIPFEEFARALERRPPSADARRLTDLVRDIDIPVYLSGAWQDEQTGARFATMMDDFTSVPAGQFKAHLYNGRHPDGYVPKNLSRWFEFLSFYVDREIPEVGLIRIGAPDVFEDFFGVPGMNFDFDRFLESGTGDPIYGDFDSTLPVYEAETPIRVSFEVGANPNVPDYPGAPFARWTWGFPSWPPPDGAERVWYLGPDGTLSDTPPATRSIDRYSFDPDIGEVSYSTTSANDFTLPQIDADWTATADGRGLSYLTDPLAQEMIIAGNGYVDLWFRSTGSDAAIEVVLSEVYADPEPADAVPPEEAIVQHGLLRAAYSDVDEARSDAMLKEHLFYEENYHPLAQGEFVHLQVPIYPVAHPFRPGSRLRLSINTPGGDTPLWEFENDSHGATTHDVALGGAMASALHLPVLPYSNPFRRIPAAFSGQENRPPCNSLRGQVCRDYVALDNETVYVEPACDADRFTDAGGDFCTDITWLSDEDITGGFAERHLPADLCHHTPGHGRLPLPVRGFARRRLPHLHHGSLPRCARRRGLLR